MKKIVLSMLAFLTICVLLVSCNDNSGDTGLSGDTSAGVSTNVDETNNTDTKVEGEDSILPYEKYGNKVYFAFEEKETNYYASVTNAKTNEDSGEITEEQYEVIVAPTDIPNDGKNYFKFIETYDELTTYISSPNVDASVFEDNYIICIKENFYLSNGWEKWFKILGYSNFKFTDNEYEISRNCYFSAYFGVHLDILAPVTLVNYLIIPKTEIDFIDGVQEISVNNNQINGDNGLWTDEFLGGNSKPMPPSTNTHACLTHDKKAVLPSESTAWVIEKESELERLLGLEPSDYSDSEFRVILYLPTEPKYDFIITKKEIKSGNLYLTIEEYSQYTNDYLKENDVNFYDLYIEDSSELADNFDVYVLVKIAGGENVDETICCTNQCECCKNNINMVMLMVQTHFYHTVKVEKEYNWYYVFKVFEEPNVFVEKLEDEYWYIMPEMYCDGEPVDYIPARSYVYIIEKSTGKIVNFLVF